MTSAEFIVNGVVEGTQGRFHVMGRCGDEPIRVGDVFDGIRIPVAVADIVPAESGTFRPVSLVVERIQAYHRQLEELDAGMTGTIDLHGSGIELIVPGCVLGSFRPAIAICGDAKLNAATT